MEALILVADLGGPTMFARIGVLRAMTTTARSGTSAHAVGSQAYRIVR
jgi:hypothetical protein